MFCALALTFAGLLYKYYPNWMLMSDVDFQGKMFMHEVTWHRNSYIFNWMTFNQLQEVTGSSFEHKQD